MAFSPETYGAVQSLIEASMTGAGAIKGQDGAPGKSAYEIAKINGFDGTEQEWLDSMVGDEGKSAYEVAVDEGFEGTEEEWLQSLTMEKTLTLAEYEALSDEEKSNGMTYYIDDGESTDDSGLTVDIKEYVDSEVAALGNKVTNAENDISELQTTIDNLISKTLVSINATKTVTNYNVDDNINLDDVTVIATYDDASTEEVDGWTSNIDDVNTLTDGYKKLEITYHHNGVTKSAYIPLTVEFTNTADNVQYGYCIARSGKMVQGAPIIQLTTKLLKRSVVNIRLRAKITINRNNNKGYTTIGFGNYNVWDEVALASHILSPGQTGEFELTVNVEREYTNANLTPDNTPIISVYNSGEMEVDGDFELLDYSISVTQEAPLLVESITAAKTQTRYIIGENVTTDDIIVTALMSDDSTKTVANFETELDVTDLDDYGKTPLSVVYTENGVTNTATVELRMYRAFLTEAQAFEDLTNYELHSRLGLGINIGNCLDSKATGNENVSVCSYDGWPNQETAWGQPEIIRQNLIDIRNKGFNTVRIPVTWCYNSGILSDGCRHPGKFWLARVNEVVQIAIEEGLYVMINMHHEQPIIFAGVQEALFEGVLKNARDMWTNIAEGLKHYSEKLIFEGFNEVDNLKSSFNYGYEAAMQMNELNQAFVDAVRSTGSNNAKRILVCPTIIHLANISALNDFVKPTDTVDNKLLLGVHTYSLAFAQDLENILQPIEECSRKLNIPVVITEWGTDNSGGAGSETSSKLPYGAEQRPDHASNFIARTVNRGFKSYWWDNGSNFTLVIRCNKIVDYGYTQEELDPIIDAMIDGFENGTAYALPKENFISYTSMNDLFYERLDTTTGESKHNYWSDVCSDYVPVVPGRILNIEVIKGAEATEEKIAFVNIVYLNENKAPIDSFTAGYMAGRYSGIIPDGAAYMRFGINSPHNNTGIAKYVSMFTSGDLAINVISYAKNEIAKIVLGNRTVSETIVHKTITKYAIGDEFNSSDITVTAILNDGTNVNISDFEVDSSKVTMNTAGEYEVTISYVYNSQTISESITVFVGDVLTGITATKTKTEYLVDEEFKTDDIAVTANYGSGYTLDVTNSCVIDSSTVNTSELGNYTVTISYSEGGVTKTCGIDITVAEFDVNNYIDTNNVVISSGNIAANDQGVTVSDEVLAEYPYVVCENNNPCYMYISKKPMYRAAEYVIFDVTCTMKQTNKNTPEALTTDSTTIQQVVGNYYRNKSKHWKLTLANHDVYKWTGAIPS